MTRFVDMETISMPTLHDCNHPVYLMIESYNASQLTMHKVH